MRRTNSLPHRIPAPRAALAAACLSSALALAGCARAERIELKPSRVDFVGLGKSIAVSARPYASNGRFLPDPPCAWSSSDEKVARVEGKANEATITTTGPGAATVRCTIGAAVSELPVRVKIVARLDVKPERLDLKVVDTPTPQPLRVEARDEAGAPLVGRTAVVTCADEAVCRGDARGQVWPVGPGETTARVELEGAAVQLAVKVTEGRSADARPKIVKGNYAEEIVKQVEEMERKEKAKQEKAAKKK